MLILSILACVDEPERDPARGRWIGEVTAYESSYYADLEGSFVGSSVELRLTNTDDGARVALLTVDGDRVGYLGDVMTGDPGGDALSEAGAALTFTLDGDRLTAVAAADPVYTVSFEAHRDGDLTPQDPDAPDGQWLVQANDAEADCATVAPSGDDEVFRQGLATLTGSSGAAVWEDPVERVSVEGELGGTRFEGDWRWDTQTDAGDPYSERVHVELDLEAGTGTEWARQTGVPCYGYNLRIARLLDTLETG